MNRALCLLVALALAPMLAGCTGGGPKGPGGATGTPTPGPGGGLPSPGQHVGADALAEGGFYAFQHDGGDLVFASPRGGSAEVVLYGGDDSRIGRIALKGGEADGRFVLDAVAPGELVLEVLALNGTLDVRSAGHALTGYDALGRHIERQVILQRQTSALGPLGLTGSPADQRVDVRLLRAPSDLRLLLRGDAQGLEVHIEGKRGRVLDAQEDSFPFQNFVPSYYEVPSDVQEDNVTNGVLSVTARASRFEGVLLLEAESFSRARAPNDAAAPTKDSPAFTYGVLPDQPVSFQVRGGAKALYFWQGNKSTAPCGRTGEGACAGQAASVALFSPDDSRFASVSVPPSGIVAVPIAQSGKWVAVLLSGAAKMGTDLAPADFGLHPLEVRSTPVPQDAASTQDGQYGQAHGPAEIQGVPFRAIPDSQSSSGIPDGPAGVALLQCGPSALALEENGETIAAWGFDYAEWSSAAEVAFGSGTLSLVHDDFGPHCARQGLLVEGYMR